MRKKNTKKKYCAGFSLVEFIVVLTIFSIMSSVSLFNYSGYSQSISETNVAQDIGLTIRQAQVYGISATGRTIGGDATATGTTIADIQDITLDRSIRGVYVDASNNSLTLFEDNPNNRNYLFDEEGNNPDRIIDVRTVTAPGVGIVGISTSNSIDCSDIEESVTISFQRPYPEAYIRNGAETSSSASILIGEDCSNYSKRIDISSIGNIAVKNN